MYDNVRIVHTGLYSNRAEELIREIVDDLQNYYCCAKKTKKMASLFNTNVKRGVDNEVILETTSMNRYRRTRLWNDLSDNQVLRHIVWMYKGLIQYRTEKDSWKRVNNELIPHSDNDFKIREVYFLYDMFHQRKNFKRNYPDNYSNELIGIPLDPITVELKNAQLDEIKKINDELKHKRSELNNQEYVERETAYKAIEAKYLKLTTEIEKAAQAKIKQLQDEMAGIASLNLLANVG
jgi:hypothetical protein